jgi:hypothetical protein
LADLSSAILRRLDRIETWLWYVYLQERANMALGQDILDAVRAETTSVDSVIALINGLVANQTVTPEVGAAILSEINASKAKLDAAIAANTP